MVKYLNLTFFILKSFLTYLLNEMEPTNEYIALGRDVWKLKKELKDIKNNLQDYDSKLSYLMPPIISIESVLLDLSEYQQIKELGETSKIFETANSLRSFPSRLANRFTWKTKGKNITIWAERIAQKAMELANDMETNVTKLGNREDLIEAIRKFRRLREDVSKDVKEHGLSSDKWNNVYKMHTINFQSIRDELGRFIPYIFGDETFLNAGENISNALSYGYESDSMSSFLRNVLPEMDVLINKIKIDQKIGEGDIVRAEKEVEKLEDELFNLKNMLKEKTSTGELSLELPKILIEIREQAKEIERIAGSRFDTYQDLTELRKLLIGKLEEAKLDKEEFYSELLKNKDDIDPRIQPNERLGEKGFETYSLAYQSIAKKIVDHVTTHERTLENLKKEFKVKAG